MKYLTEAKIIADFLEKEKGWDIYDKARCCVECGMNTYNEVAKYCPICGTKLPEAPTNMCGIKEIAEALEAAFGGDDEHND